MNIETIEAIRQLSNTGFFAVVIYAFITSLADLILIIGFIFGCRAIWKKAEEHERK